jgi:CubicO group peptidase (beta-lactamase class C family)
VDERFAGVRAEMERQVADGLRPAIQVSVSWRGRAVFDHAVGAGATPDSNFVLWSTTKPLVAVALLQLVEEGKAALTDRVSRFLPEFGCNGKERATLAHVLSHRGGFPDSDPEVRRPLQKVMRDFDAAVAAVCELPARWEPGTDRGYHPATGWFVLAELIQRLDDRPIREAVRERVIERAGMDPTGVTLGEPERLASPPLAVHTRDEKGAPPEAEARFWNDPETHAAVIPGASGIARARELVRFYGELLAGLRGEGSALLSREMIRVATVPHAVGTRDRTFLLDIPWGLGFHLKHAIPSLDDCGASATPGTFGHGGHFLVNTAWADPGKDLVCCVLSNGLTASKPGIDGVRRLSQAVHDAVDSS